MSLSHVARFTTQWLLVLIFCLSGYAEMIFRVVKTSVIFSNADIPSIVPFSSRKPTIRPSSGSYNARNMLETKGQTKYERSKEFHHNPLIESTPLTLPIQTKHSKSSKIGAYIPMKVCENSIFELKNIEISSAPSLGWNLNGQLLSRIQLPSGSSLTVYQFQEDVSSTEKNNFPLVAGFPCGSHGTAVASIILSKIDNDIFTGKEPNVWRYSASKSVKSYDFQIVQKSDREWGETLLMCLCLPTVDIKKKIDPLASKSHHFPGHENEWRRILYSSCDQNTADDRSKRKEIPIHLFTIPDACVWRINGECLKPEVIVSTINRDVLDTPGKDQSERRLVNSSSYHRVTTTIQSSGKSWITLPLIVSPPSKRYSNQCRNATFDSTKDSIMRANDFDKHKREFIYGVDTIQRLEESIKSIVLAIKPSRLGCIGGLHEGSISVASISSHEDESHGKKSNDSKSRKRARLTDNVMMFESAPFSLIEVHSEENGEYEQSEKSPYRDYVVFVEASLRIPSGSSHNDNRLYALCLYNTVLDNHPYQIALIEIDNNSTFKSNEKNQSFVEDRSPHLLYWIFLQLVEFLNEISRKLSATSYSELILFPLLVAIIGTTLHHLNKWRSNIVPGRGFTSYSSGDLVNRNSFFRSTANVPSWLTEKVNSYLLQKKVKNKSTTPPMEWRVVDYDDFAEAAALTAAAAHQARNRPRLNENFDPRRDCDANGFSSPSQTIYENFWRAEGQVQQTITSEFSSFPFY